MQYAWSNLWLKPGSWPATQLLRGKQQSLQYPLLSIPFRMVGPLFTFFLISFFFIGKKYPCNRQHGRGVGGGGTDRQRL
jgi:hypothetical protein